MKAQTKDAVALAMDWLAQLRDEDAAEPPPGDNQPAIDGGPAAGDFEGEVTPAGPVAGEWDAASPAQAAGDFGDAAPAAPPAADWEDARPAVPPAVDGGMSLRPRHTRSIGSSLPRPRRPRPTGDARPAAPTATDFGDAAPAVPPGTTSPGRARMKADIEITERAAIGDELRIPLAWCEMGSCISHYTDPAALGEADIRTRAIAAGWRADALGRLACPQCQQGDSWFWTAHPVALWDRDTAVAMTTLLAAAMREIAGADGAAGMERGALPGGEPGPIPAGEPGPTPGGEAGPIPAGEPGPTPGGEAGPTPGKVPGPRPEMARQPGRGRHRGHPAHPDRAQ